MTLRRIRRRREKNDISDIVLWVCEKENILKLHLWGTLTILGASEREKEREKGPKNVLEQGKKETMGERDKFGVTSRE